MSIKNIIDHNELKTAFNLIEQANIPSPPKLLLDLKSELSLESPDDKKIINLIQSDIGLVSAIIKAINSPLFGLASEIQSVEYAIKLLGINKLKQHIVQPAYKLALSNTIKDFSYISEQSHYIGQIAEIIGKELISENQGMYYLAGLFHNVGTIVIALVNNDPDIFNWYETHGNHPITIRDNERDTFKVTHSSIGVLLARKWGLPHKVCNAIYLHHHVETLYNTEIDQESMTMTSVLKLASYFYKKTVSPATSDSYEWQIFYANTVNELMLDGFQISQIELNIFELDFK